MGEDVYIRDLVDFDVSMSTSRGSSVYYFIKTSKDNGDLSWNTSSRPRELRRQLQRWKRFGRLHLIVFVLVRNIVTCWEVFTSGPQSKSMSLREKRTILCTWMAFGGNTHDLGSFGEETDEITDLHQILEELLHTEREDGVTSIKRRRRDLFSDDVWNLETASGCGRLKEDLESST
nr:hypothetical protein [Tanacetum cinerariifolium]